MLCGSFSSVQPRPFSMCLSAFELVCLPQLFLFLFFSCIFHPKSYSHWASSFILFPPLLRSKFSLLFLSPFFFLLAKNQISLLKCNSIWRFIIIHVLLRLHVPLQLFVFYFIFIWHIFVPTFPLHDFILSVSIQVYRPFNLDPAFPLELYLVNFHRSSTRRKH